MIQTVQDYLNLVTSEHRQKPNFIATLEALVKFPVYMQNLLATMIPLFDVDIAVGDQLDIIGLWAGITRNVRVPIPGVYFSWDGTADVGWDYGTWSPNLGNTAVTVLPDDAYRTLLKTKIAANGWDGTTEGAYAIWDRVFKNFTILIQDNNNMSYDLAFVGGIVDSLSLALIVGGYIPLKPEGVRVADYYVSVDSNPAFGWDVESAVIGGWDTCSWLREFSPL